MTEPVPLALEDLFAVLEGLPGAPELPEPADMARAIDRRRAIVRDCAFGDGYANTALHMGPSPLMYGQARWLDACWLHYAALRKLAAGQWPEDDKTLMARWCDWHAARETAYYRTRQERIADLFSGWPQ